MVEARLVCPMVAANVVYVFDVTHLCVKIGMQDLTGTAVSL